MRKEKLYRFGDCSAYSLQIVAWKNQKTEKKGIQAQKLELKGKSPIEAKLAEILNLINPNFKMNMYVGKYEVDFLYEKEKLVIEANGKHFHNPKKDSIKDNYLKNQGYLVVPVTGSDIMNRSWEVYRKIKWMFKMLGFRTCA